MPTLADLELADLVATCYHDPLRFVRAMYPWGEPGPLQAHPGPDAWQARFLEEIGRQCRARRFDGVTPVPPLRFVVSSGHGVGKSVVTAWLVHWIMATRPMAHGTVTANTFAQLETKTWATIQRWAKLCLCGHWFECGPSRMAHPQHKESWFCAPQSCREENSEAFAGQHAADSTSFYIFDEASAVPDAIFDVAEGGLTDGEPMIFLMGNPTRSQGAFYRRCWGNERHRWTSVVVDARESRFTNQAQIAEWVADYGEDSDFVRVRVRGLPPAASDLQFIDSARVQGAMGRPVEVLPDEPLVMGVDVARGGEDSSVIWFRRGVDARSIQPVVIPGEQTRDAMRLVSVCAEALGRTYAGRTVALCCVDATGIGGPVGDRLRQLGFRQVMDVQFGGMAPEARYANMRAYMWASLRDWLTKGALPRDGVLEVELTGPGYTHDRGDRLVLESKEKMKARGMASPDRADALALTFAYPVAVGTGRPVSRAGVLVDSWQAL